MVSLTEGFETYPVGFEPYPTAYPALFGGTGGGTVSNVRAHSGTKSLTETPGQATVTLVSGSITSPCLVSAWVYLTRRPPGALTLFTPDVGLVLPNADLSEFEAYSIIGFADGEDVFGIPINHMYVFDTSTGATAGEEIPADGWYQYRLDLTTISPTVARITASVVSEGGVVYLNQTSNLTTPVTPLAWGMVLNPTVESWFDDIQIGPSIIPAPVKRSPHPVRRYPRDDGNAMSSAPRLYPPPRASRVFGGHL